MIKDEVESLEDIAFHAEVGLETGSMYSHDAVDKMLDYGDDSIEAFDAALGAVGDELRLVGNPSFVQRILRKLLSAEPEPTDGEEEAVYYGCYFGQLLVKNHGWQWTRDEQLGYVIEKDGKQVQPDVLVLERLRSEDAGTIIRIYRDLAK
ncbi:MAG: hypothetical protein AB8C95_14300 [Phycisphaeraceae bacterium]